MPPKIRITREAILAAALDLVRRAGSGALNARAVARELNCSTQPIFSNYATMEELFADVMAAAKRLYQQYLSDGMRGAELPYKASGQAYIRFAKEEPELFRLLYMRDRTGQNIPDEKDDIQNLLEIIKANVGVSETEALYFHVEMWIFVHGIATMIATGYMDWDEDMVGRMMSDAFLGIKTRFQNQHREES